MYVSFLIASLFSKYFRVRSGRLVELVGASADILAPYPHIHGTNLS